MHRLWKRLLMVIVLVAIGAGIALLFRPKPVIVETAAVSRGPMQVTIDEDGETRAHDRFTLAAPVAGFLSRIDLHEGDSVSPQTVIATVRPLPVDVREAAEIRARIASAQALQREAEAQVARAETNYEQAKRDLDRANMLAKDDIIPRQQVEQAQSNEAARAKELDAARYRVTAAIADVKKQEAGLISVQTDENQKGREVAIRSPISARILRILEKSERVVASGTPIVSLSNPNRIEIVIDLLSTDAVKVKPGASVSIENWGGDKPLRARVRMVEPYGFTKVSALGIEEQRVNVIADFLEVPRSLGDGYRVDARIVIWEGTNVLKVPASALYRAGQDWRVFLVESARAHSTPVKVGHRNSAEAEVLEGLQEGMIVIMHPSNDLKEGMRVAVRSR